MLFLLFTATFINAGDFKTLLPSCETLFNTWNSFSDTQKYVIMGTAIVGLAWWNRPTKAFNKALEHGKGVESTYTYKTSQDKQNYEDTDYDNDSRLVAKQKSFRYYLLGNYHLQFKPYCIESFNQAGCSTNRKSKRGSPVIYPTLIIQHSFCFIPLTTSVYRKLKYSTEWKHHSVDDDDYFLTIPRSFNNWIKHGYFIAQ